MLLFIPILVTMINKISSIGKVVQISGDYYEDYVSYDDNIKKYKKFWHFGPFNVIIDGEKAPKLYQQLCDYYDKNNDVKVFDSLTRK